MIHEVFCGSSAYCIDVYVGKISTPIVIKPNDEHHRGGKVK